MLVFMLDFIYTLFRLFVESMSDYSYFSLIVLELELNPVDTRFVAIGFFSYAWFPTSIFIMLWSISAKTMSGASNLMTS